MRILHVVGARPNFMKAAPVMEALSRPIGAVEQVLIHTGQHYDRKMSQVFFAELGLPRPDLNLEVGSGSHAWQTAQVMLKFEPELIARRPDWVLVYGDVNSTLAAALVCSKLGVRLAHVEAGLRSYDRSMPEECNRLLVDQMADLLLTPTRDADGNLQREGIPQERIRFVGNVMIDTLVRLLPQARDRTSELLQQFDANDFLLVTLHRPSNVDHPTSLGEIVEALAEAASRIPVLFPIHPRTRARLEKWGLETRLGGVRLLEPLGYLDFLALQTKARLVLTDSGGIQEETTFLGVPCLTVRPNTERPVTIELGTNRLVSARREALVQAIQEGIGSERSDASPPELWDGRAGERIARTLASLQRSVEAGQEPSESAELNES